MRRVRRAHPTFGGPGWFGSRFLPCSVSAPDHLPAWWCESRAGGDNADANLSDPRLPMDQDRTSEHYAERVTGEQVALLYNYFSRQYWLLLLSPPIVVPVMWSQVAHVPLVLWGIVYVVSVLDRRLLAQRYFDARPPASEARRWGMRFTVRAAISGVLLGSCGFWMFAPYSLPHLMFLFAFLFVTSAGAALFFAPFPPAYYAFLPLATMPLVVRVLLVGTVPAIWACVAVVVYTLFMLRVGRDYGEAIRRSFELRFQNLDLVQELTRKNEEAERANRAKSQFLAAASHDLRQPMQALSLLTGTLKLRSAAGPDRDLVERIGASVEALEGLFSALLDISKLDASVVRTERGSVSLSALLTRIETDAAPGAEAKGLRLRVHRIACWVDSDPVLLRRILQNLVANAIRHTGSGTVWVGARRRGDKVRIEVRDSGSGIAAEHLDRIFEEFYQVENPGRDRRKGLGLGLAIVRRLTDLLGHTVEVRSMPGRGSTFAVTVPLAPTPGAVAEAGGSGGVRPDLLGLAVLVLEDDAEVRAALRITLEEWGCYVVAAVDEADALSQARQRPRWRPQAILTDYRLGSGRSGIEAARSLLAHWDISIPVVLISGDTADEPLRAAQASGYELLHKPIRPQRLERLLRDLPRR